jgi:hypothetical protein
MVSAAGCVLAEHSKSIVRRRGRGRRLRDPPGHGFASGHHLSCVGRRLSPTRETKARLMALPDWTYSTYESMSGR